MSRRNVRATALVALLLAAAAVGPGCRSITSREATGTGIGAVVGGGAGYALGRHYGSRSTGVLIGAATGGLLGYLIGDSLDEAESERAGPETIQGSDRPWRHDAGAYPPCAGCDDPR